ncbi:MAG: hypothetical protein VX207_02285 [Candidatus Neomarinimicrobiota bacterium]|nr:hypothetical protein [Candidatus Neomarinimicrobiota bacterium]
MFGKLSRRILFIVVGYIIVFIIPFVFLSTYELDDTWKYTPFVTGMIATFMGGGTIAIITAALLIFQKSLDLEHKQKENVQDKKLDLYEKIVQKISEIIQDDNITKNEHYILKNYNFILNLVAEYEVQDAYEKFLKKLEKNRLEGQDSWKFELEEIEDDFYSFIDTMSESLNVPESLNPEKGLLHASKIKKERDQGRKK